MGVSIPKSDSSVALCGEAVCLVSLVPISYFSDEHLKRKRTASVNSKHWQQIRCDERADCFNTLEGVPIDELGCNDKFQEELIDVCEFFKDDTPLRKSQICDDICDCTFCEDEANCHNMTIGLFCTDFYLKVEQYIGPLQICNNRKDCISGIDESMCDNYNESCASKSVKPVELSHWSLRRTLTPNSKCSIPNIGAQPFLQVCSDFRDQMNCSFSTISPLTCQVDGYPTTISNHIICSESHVPNRILCDDQVDRQCVEPEFECRIHKHRLCDGINDCPKRYDEENVICKDMVQYPVDCVRRWSYTKVVTRIPQKWVLDGVSDCMNSIDEDPKKWTRACGLGLRNSFIYSVNDTEDMLCSSTQFKCPNRRAEMKLDLLCTGKSYNCDFGICEAARKNYRTTGKIPNKVDLGETRQLFYCLLGLKDLEDKIGHCSHRRLSYQRKLAGVDDLFVLLSEEYAMSHVDCRNLFGEVYVYVACSNFCGGVASCPLRPLLVSSYPRLCFNTPRSNIVVSLNEDDMLGVAVREAKSHDYTKAVFACDNGQCLSFEKVCNLIVDCKDGSDEINCTNNFECHKSGDYVPLTSKCDGEFDCYDLSDECNDECRNQTEIFNHISMFVIALLFGIIATLFNFINLINGLREYSLLKTETAQVNKCFVLLIAFSDLLQSVFMVLLSIGDKFLNKSTCATPYEWKTSTLCTVLGVISTIGSLLSLYSMTTLSVIRAAKFRSIVAPRETMSKRTWILLSLTLVSLFSLTTLVASLPVLVLEDYFIFNYDYTDNSIFVGAPDKNKLMKVINTYYGRVSKSKIVKSGHGIPWCGIRNLVNDLFTGDISGTNVRFSGSSGVCLSRFFERKHDHDISWSEIRNMVDDMFTNDIIGTNLGFYGNNGFCLFSYFVRNDVSYRWYSILVLLTNFLCVLIIGGCYIFLNIFARKTVGAVEKSPSAKANRKLHSIITIISISDVLLWLPFIIVCV